MQNLPKPMLGEITALTITTPDLDKSLAYYGHLGFSLIHRADWPFPWIQVSDGVLLIMLRKDPKPYLALTYYVEDIARIMSKVEQNGVEISQKPKKTDMVKRCLIKSPDGLNISLVNITEGFAQPPGPGMLRMNPEDYFKPEKYVNKACGLFGELAHPVSDLDASVAFWQKLGFNVVSKFTAPYPWAIVSDGLAVVGLHQSGQFDFPAITYFAADMGTKIAALKKAGLKNVKEQNPSNAVLTTPEKQHIFLYQLGGMWEAAEKEKKAVPKAPTLETPRLILKELNQEILDELFTGYDDGDIMTFMGLTDTDALSTEKNKWAKGMTTYRISFKRFLIIEKETGKVVGSCGFHNWHADHDRAEIGYSMTTESAKNKGYMREALAAVISFGFDKMNLNRVEAFISPDNVPSLRLVQGFGFTEEGRLRSHYRAMGKMYDSVCYGLLKNEYKKVKKSWSKWL